MDGNYLFIGELLLTLGAAVGLGLWELRRTNRAIRERREAERRAEARD